MEKLKKEKGKTKNFIFINKTAFFPEQKVLAVGDLHLGFEHMLREAGIELPETQIDDIIKGLEDIFSELKSKGHRIDKIVFLGDIKHYFGFEYRERHFFNKVLDFLKEHFNDRDIILIKGNHDRFDYSGKKMKDYYIYKGLGFIHGHMNFPQIFREDVKKIIMGHLHPSIILSDKHNIKREKFKCYLTGEYKDKEIIVLPSFFDIIEGKSVNEYNEEYHRFISIIPPRNILNFKIHVIGDDGVYDFGKVRDL